MDIAEITKMNLPIAVDLRTSHERAIDQIAANLELDAREIRYAYRHKDLDLYTSLTDFFIIALICAHVPRNGPHMDRVKSHVLKIMGAS